MRAPERVNFRAHVHRTAASRPTTTPTATPSRGCRIITRLLSGREKTLHGHRSRRRRDRLSAPIGSRRFPRSPAIVGERRRRRRRRYSRFDHVVCAGQQASERAVRSRRAYPRVFLRVRPASVPSSSPESRTSSRLPPVPSAIRVNHLVDGFLY